MNEHFVGNVRFKWMWRDEWSPSNSSHKEPAKHANSAISVPFDFAGSSNGDGLILENLIEVVVNALTAVRKEEDNSDNSLRAQSLNILYVVLRCACRSML